MFKFAPDEFVEPTTIGLICPVPFVPLSGTQIDGEYGTQQFDTIHDPLAAVFEIETRMGIFTTKKRTPDTSGDAMVIGRVLQ